MSGTGPRQTPWPQSASYPLVQPLQPSVVYVTETPDAMDAQYEGVTEGYAYAREGHPNADVVAQQIDRLEGAKGGIMTGSGMAAVGAVLMGLTKSGDHVIGGNQLYGRSLRMLRDDLPRMGVATDLFDPTDASTLEGVIRPETRIILVEVVSNPTLRISDMAAIAAIAKARGILLFVDNTFTTPLGCRAYDLGADIIMHSVTKLLAGHSDATLGYAVCKDPDLQDQMATFAMTMGLTASPFDCWLADRGLATFPLRYAQACRNAAKLADVLADSPAVECVLYPGRADHPDHNRASAVLSGQHGNMVTFDIKGGREKANALSQTQGIFPLAPTLGDVSTTLSHPASSSHRGLTDDQRHAIGITEGTFRMSVGVEETEGLVAQLANALANFT
ncbi:MAG: aminotransferase class I/II-fold pyridoxal phosphate-dependent enzyme [Pseudomonadota bacterium]